MELKNQANNFFEISFFDKSIDEILSNNSENIKLIEIPNSIPEEKIIHMNTFSKDCEILIDIETFQDINEVLKKKLKKILS
jgi:hypothetical protein